jgi:hypothetical protein
MYSLIVQKIDRYPHLAKYKVFRRQVVSGFVGSGNLSRDCQSLGFPARSPLTLSNVFAVWSLNCYRKYLRPYSTRATAARSMNTEEKCKKLIDRLEREHLGIEVFLVSFENYLKRNDRVNLILPKPTALEKPRRVVTKAKVKTVSRSAIAKLLKVDRRQVTNAIVLLNFLMPHIRIGRKLRREHFAAVYAMFDARRAVSHLLGIKFSFIELKNFLMLHKSKPVFHAINRIVGDEVGRAMSNKTIELRFKSLA